MRSYEYPQFEDDGLWFDDEEYCDYIDEKRKQQLEEELENLYKFLLDNDYAYHQESNDRINKIKEELCIY